MTGDSTNTSIVSSINPQMHEGELRILDVDLAARLGFVKPTKIRDLIKRHIDSLEKLGPLPTVGRVINGGNAKEYYLNRKQAIFITGKSDTPEATAITIEIIEKFDAYERGATAPAIATPKTLREALLFAADQAAKIEEQEKALAVVTPKAEAHEMMSALGGELGVRDVGRELKMGQQWVTKTVEERDWACRQGGKLRPTHYGLTRGYCRLIPSVYECSMTGETRVRDDFKITRKGIGRLAEVIARMKRENTGPFARTREGVS